MSNGRWLMMDRRKMMQLVGAGSMLAMRPSMAQAQYVVPGIGTDKDMKGIEPDTLLLKDYRPKSLYKIPVSHIPKAKYPVIDCHCHGRWGDTLEEKIKVMDEAGIEKTVIFTAATSGEQFEKVRQQFGNHKDRFDFWCNLDLSHSETPDCTEVALKALDECHSAGAVGVGELGDKGMGLGRSVGDGPAGWPGGTVQSKIMGPHCDDPRLDPVWDRCAQLGLPVNFHVSNIIWVYYPQDYTNDGLMNEFIWRLDNKPGILPHNDLIEGMERMVARHPKTTYIMCHFANLDYDFTRLSGILDKYPNMYVDNAAQFCETSATPRATLAFYKKYPDRIVYGTDMTYSGRMFATTFRILESLDEHFYEHDFYFTFNYHWPMSGFGLPDDILKKVYSENARAIFRKARSGAA